MQVVTIGRLVNNVKYILMASYIPQLYILYTTSIYEQETGVLGTWRVYMR